MEEVEKLLIKVYSKLLFDFQFQSQFSVLQTIKIVQTWRFADTADSFRYKKQFCDHKEFAKNAAGRLVQHTGEVYQQNLLADNFENVCDEYVIINF